MPSQPQDAPPRRSIVISLLAALLPALSACTTAPPAPGPPSVPAPPASSANAPKLQVSTLVGGLSHVWDVGFLPDGKLLVTQRPGKLTILSSGSAGAVASDVQADLEDVMARGEGGLMGLAVHPDFATSRRFTTCQTHGDGTRLVDVRLVTWQLSPDLGSARRVADPLVGGLPVNQSGRHSGCRPTVAPDGSLLVGTGDSANGTIAQDRGSLGGKTLRVDLATGGPAPGNPFAGSADPAERLIWTYGHRNVQGVAIRPDPSGGFTVFTAEHGPDRNDEVNKLVAGKNYGWDPGQGGTVGGYDEDVPMTDLDRFPDAVRAIWSSGQPVDATSGLAYLSGPQWGALNGGLAVAALRGSKLLLMRLGPDDAVAEVAVPAELDGTFGRLRAARTGPDGALYVTSSNGTNDVVLRITPG